MKGTRFFPKMSWHINPLNSLAQGSIVSPDGHGKKQVEQVWVTPSYDVSGSGVSDGVIKHNPTARSCTWVSCIMAGKQKKFIQGTCSPGDATSASPGL